MMIQQIETVKDVVWRREAHQQLSTIVKGSFVIHEGRMIWLKLLTYQDRERSCIVLGVDTVQSVVEMFKLSPWRRGKGSGSFTVDDNKTGKISDSQVNIEWTQWNWLLGQIFTAFAPDCGTTMNSIAESWRDKGVYPSTFTLHWPSTSSTAIYSW